MLNGCASLCVGIELSTLLLGTIYKIGKSAAGAFLKTWYLVPIAFAFFGFSEETRAEPSQPHIATNEMIMSDWKRRMDHVRSYCFTWNEETFYVKGGLGKTNRIVNMKLA